MNKKKTISLLFILAVFAVSAFIVWHMHNVRKLNRQNKKTDITVANDKNKGTNSLKIIPQKKTSSTGVVIAGRKYLNKFGKEYFSAELKGQQLKDKVKLIFILNGWPERTDGFVIQRKDKNGSWRQLNSDIVRNYQSEDRDYTKMGMSLREANRYKQLYSEYKQQGKIKDVANAEFLTYMEKYGMRAGDRIRIRRDNNFAMFLGFGFIDHAPLPNVVYGLFSVNGNKVSEQPVATYENTPVNPNILKAQSFRYEPIKNGVKILWDIPIDIYAKVQLTGYNVYKRKTAESSWSLLGTTYKNPNKTDKAFFSYTDKSNNGKDDCQYALAAYDFFDKEFSKELFVFNSDKDGMLSELPQISSLTTSGEDVILKWDTPKQDLKKIKKYMILKEVGIGNKENIIEDNLAVKQKMEYVDKKESNWREYLSYKVVALTNGGELKYSSTKNIKSPASPPKVNAPSNFKITTEKNSNGRYQLKQSWDKVKDAKYYVLYRKGLSDKQFVQYKTSNTNSKIIDYPARGINSIVKSYAVSAVDKNDIEGEKAYINNVSLPPVKLFGVKNITHEQNTGTVTLGWTPSDQSVIGFNIYVNGKLIKSSKELKSNARSATLTKKELANDNDKSFLLSIVIEELNELTTTKEKFGLYYNNVSKESQELPVIKNFQCAELNKNGKNYIQLTWDALDLKKENLSGYKLTAHISTPISLKTLIPEYKKQTENSYLYAVPENVKSGAKITFKLNAVKITKEPKAIHNGSWVKQIIDIK